MVHFEADDTSTVALDVIKIAIDYLRRHSPFLTRHHRFILPIVLPTGAIDCANSEQISGCIHVLMHEMLNKGVTRIHRADGFYEWSPTADHTFPIWHCRPVPDSSNIDIVAELPAGRS